jgi:acetolactate synthase-1/3 small subunit
MASLFRKRGFNIESVTVGHSETPSLSRVTLVVNGSATTVEQVRKQLDKVIDIVKVSDVTDSGLITRELTLVKVKTTPATRSSIMQIVDIFRANIVDVSFDSVTIEATGDEDKISSLFNLLRGFGIKELTRTGRIALVRGDSSPLLIEKEPSVTDHQ